MATAILLPNADVSNDWTLSTGSDVYALLDDDHTSTVASDSNYIYSGAAGVSCIVDLQNFTEAHSAINSVQLTTESGNTTRGKSYTINTKLTSASGDYYTENSGTIAANRFYIEKNYTARTTHDGSNAWTEALLNSLRVQIDLSISSGGTTQVTYCYVTVDYDPPVADSTNAIFFGANF